MFKNIFSSKLDFLAIGDITTDAFIRIKEASVHCNIDNKNCEICMKFADKIPFEDVFIVKAVGNSSNAAVSAARLGLKSALVTNIGGDQNGKDCLAELKKNNVVTRYVTTESDKKTNYHYVLWYEAERTILIKHQEYNYHLPALPTGNQAPRWIYLSSFAEKSGNYHDEIQSYLTANPEVKLAFQPGTFQMKLGTEKLKYFYERSEVFVVNLEESQRILATEEKDLKILLRKIADLGPKIVCINDGPAGAYMLDTRANNGAGESYYMPIYPDPKAPLERTGCGDSFASTFVAALIYGKTPLEALIWAPINPMSVVQYIGAQEGLLSRAALEKLLKEKPATYEPRVL